MRVRLLTLITFVLLLATNPRITHPNATQSDSALTTIMMESQEGIAFYRLVEGNELEQVGALPDDFSIERSPEAEWQLLSWPGINLTLSPDGELIAFTIRNEDDSSGFFVYSIAENTVDEVFVTSPMSFSLQFEWSSDSSAVLLQPIGCECSGNMYPRPETYVYQITTNSWYAITNTPDRVEHGFEWSPDNNSIIYASNEGDAYMVDAEGNNRHLLVDAESQAPPDAFASTCNFAWSDNQQRWYYELGCLRGLDSWDHIYSVDLTGNIRLEAALPNMYSEEFRHPEMSSPVDFLDVIALRPADNTMYAVIEMLVGTDNGLSDIWRVIRIDAPETIVTMFEFLNGGEMFQTLFSPDNRQVALVSYDMLVVASLSNGQVIAQVEKNPNGIYKAVRWLNEHTLLYGDETDIWLLNTDNGSIVNLTANFDERAWLLTQTRPGAYIN